MNIDPLFLKQMINQFSGLIIYFGKAKLPKELKVFKGLILKELLNIYASLNNVKKLIEKLKEQLEKTEPNNETD